MTERADRSRRELQARLLDKAWKDEAFRRALIADPKGMLEKELGVPLAADFSLTVLEETPTTRYLVLPPAPTGAAGELSDAELAAVAGGDGEAYTEFWTVPGCCGQGAIP
jgi:hypothetical protein